MKNNTENLAWTLNLHSQSVLQIPHALGENYEAVCFSGVRENLKTLQLPEKLTRRLCPFKYSFLTSYKLIIRILQS